MPFVKDYGILIMNTFEPLKEIDIRQMLERSSDASGAVDPISIWLIKECNSN